MASADQFEAFLRSLPLLSRLSHMATSNAADELLSALKSAALSVETDSLNLHAVCSALLSAEASLAQAGDEVLNARMLLRAADHLRCAVFPCDGAEIQALARARRAMTAALFEYAR